eukprot:scaffold4.g4615.t1
MYSDPAADKPGTYYYAGSSQPPPGYPAAPPLPGYPPAAGGSDPRWGPPPPAGAWQQAGPSAYQPQYGAPPPYGYGRPPAGGAYPAAAGVGAASYKPPARPGGMDGYDAEAAAAAAYASAFAEQKVRQAFIRKVFGLVFLQLCVTVGVACVFMFVKPVKCYVRPWSPTYNPTTRTYEAKPYSNCGEGQWVFWTAWALAFATLIALTCSTTLRRRHPWNLFTLAWFTVVESVLVGVICAYWDVSVVLEAFGTTCAVVGALALAAIFIPFDMTKRGGVLAICSMVFFAVVMMTLFFAFFYVSTWWYLAIAIIGALLFAAYLVYDIQMVMGGKTLAISPDEYVFASVQIYMDVITMFLFILSIFGFANR